MTRQENVPGPPNFEEPPEVVASQVAEEFRFAIEHEGPVFLLVHYDHEQDKVRFLDALRRRVANDGYGTQTLDPAHRPEHGSGFLYPLLSEAGDHTLTLVTSLPRDGESSRPDGIFLGYINLHRDDIGRRRLRWVLCLHTSEVEAFQDRAGDLWDVRQRTYWLERHADDTPGKAFLEADRPQAIAAPATLEASDDEIEREIQRVRERVRELELPRHKVGALLGLAGWLNRRRASRDAIEAATAGLELVGETPTVDRAKLLHHLAFAYSHTGHFSESLERYEESLKVSRSIGDRAGEGKTLNNIAFVFKDWGRLDHAIEQFEQSLKIHREVGDRASEGTALNNIALVYQDWGKLDHAIERFEQSLEISREVGDRAGEGTTLNNIANVYRSSGKLNEALERYEQSLRIRREVGDRAGESTTLNNIGVVYRVWGKLDEALEQYEQSLRIQREVGDRAGEGTTLNNIALVYESWGKLDEALEQYEQSLFISREVGDRAGELVTRMNLGRLHEQMGDLDKAIDQIRTSTALQADLKHPDLDKSRAYFAALEARLDAESSPALEIAEPTTSYRTDAD